ncbi:hypothetical protein [Yimella sp. cx-51]|uniref:sunset domain-containing protein n=1 Tax=Yimella sp. cx-51 TaxID=2770551 RepID=UPI001AD877CE|nr:hypothetical protein [Yimella sp. cx-51]QTH38013.1 hypothetical protein J5M86_14480 [Yimella sp. cx-51]
MSRFARLSGVTAIAVGSALLTATPADAAPTVSTRIAGYTVSPTSITKGASIQVKGQSQKLSGARWVAAPGTRVTVYFDADGTAPNKSMGSFTVDKYGNFAPKFVPSTSGYWSVVLPQTAVYKVTATSRKYVKVNTPTSYRPPTGSWNCPSWAPIKGNASSRIYHLPGQRYYSKTKPEMCFANERAAIAAGYRKSKV